MRQPKDMTRAAQESEEKREKGPLSETWSQDAQDELEDFIEQQGIYIRQ